MNINKLLTYTLIVISLLSCGEYYDVKESKDTELKYTKALEYYQKGEYDKTEYLLNEIMPFYRGTSKYENISYHYVMSLYNQELYSIAAHYFNLFTSTFPQSEKIEECYYLSPFCFYKESPDVRLDQENTQRAVSGFLRYIKLYPDSDKIAQINKYLDECRDKLTKKSYLNAKLYYDREKFKSAIAALNNSLNDYPESSYREKVKYLLVQSYYQFALNSIAEKQKERYKDAIESVELFLEEFPSSEYNEDIKEIQEEIKNIYQ